ncbi:MAG TPA: GGDEF domain-containing protein [Acidobacteriaceae bacterium]|jgi:diguanylate cyclase (GGDEF)-like protein|nr:GGDEF domain-containing protein [Acidobacteriaceae bacterium]
MLNGAVVMLAVNIAVGLLFASAYTVVAFANRGQRRVLWFGACYLIGTLEPAGDLLAPFFGHSSVLDWISHLCFLSGLASMSLSFAYFHRQAVPWRSFVFVLLTGLLLRFLISSWPQDTLAYGFGYQIPFTMASGLDTIIVLRNAQKRPLYILLGTVFSLTALHFLLKPFLLVRYGGGGTAVYTKTAYALLSQASTGFLLLACGILLLILVSHKALTDSHLASETDSLSGVHNRRGFDQKAVALLEDASGTQAIVTAAIFDIDFFKKINDTYGHATGDRVIAEFAAALREVMPPDSVLGRIGGEEFAALIVGHNMQSAWQYAEEVRRKFPLRLKQELDVSVSGGITSWISGEQVSELMKRADQALYTAKNSGRNQVVIAER